MIDISPEHLRELERFAEIGRLSAGWLHEISNPLTAAMLWLEQCKGHQSPHMRHVRSSMRLLHRYVEAARQQVRCESRYHNFCVQSELEQVRYVLAPLAGRRGISLQFTSADDLSLYGDPVKFQHIIANLIRNAIDSYDNCPAGGHRPVRLDMIAMREYLVVEVSDQGCGIDSGQLEKLFQPFYSTKSGAGRGLGIGLSGVKRSVEADFGGTIKVQSSKRRGTRFIVKLRLASRVC